MNRTPPLPPHKFLAQLEEGGNDVGVRNALAAGRYSPQHASVAKEWLKQREDERALSAAVKRDDREEETLRIANEALSSAKEANRIARDNSASARAQARWAMWAAIIATVAAIIATVKAG